MSKNKAEEIRNLKPDFVRDGKSESGNRSKTVPIYRNIFSYSITPITQQQDSDSGCRKHLRSSSCPTEDVFRQRMAALEAALRRGSFRAAAINYTIINLAQKGDHVSIYKEHLQRFHHNATGAHSSAVRNQHPHLLMYSIWMSSCGN